MIDNITAAVHNSRTAPFLRSASGLREESIDNLASVGLLEGRVSRSRRRDGDIIRIQRDDIATQGTGYSREKKRQ
jgi:hypothetical protein